MVDAITRLVALATMRDAVLATYDTCEVAAVRAGLLVAAVAPALGPDEARVWRHAQYRLAATADGLATVVDLEQWAAIEAGPGWSTSELVLVRVAADLADYGHVLQRRASVGDLFYLDDRNYRAVQLGLEEARATRGPDPARRQLLADTFAPLIARADQVVGA